VSAPIDRAALLREGAAALTAAGVEPAAGDARALLRWASGLSGAAFSASLRDAPAGAEAAAFRAAIAARKARQPVSQIIGAREFWGRSFEVTPDVLDPRPETEVLIAAALHGPAPARMLDLGVGSGCILLSLLAEWPEARGLGIDASRPALAVAARNADALGLGARVDLRLGDWARGLEGIFDLIVSNPPYIPQAQMAGLSPEVALWEPRLALTPGGDGLGAYRAIAGDLARLLAPGGRALFEVGAGQGPAVSALLQAAGRMISVHDDFDGRGRCVEMRTR
jgi:release factor glutamine methyltransferase